MVLTMSDDAEYESLIRTGGVEHEENHRARHGDIYFPILQLAFGDPAQWMDTTILVLFAGRGREAEFFLPFAKKLLLVDDNPACVEMLRQRFGDRSCTEILQNNGFDLLEIPDETVDYCTAFVALMHILSKDVRDSYAAELQRVLRPGGRVLLQVIEGDGWESVLEGAYGSRNVGFLSDQKVYEYWSRYFEVELIIRTRAIPSGVGKCWWWVVGKKGEASHE